MKRKFGPFFLVFLTVFFNPAGFLFAQTLTGYVIHFDFFNTKQEARQMLDVAEKAGALVVNIVPPAHVWERSDALAILDDLIDQIGKRKLKFVITRVDASYPRDQEGKRFSFLYGKILTSPGRLPGGEPSNGWFHSTVGLTSYETWMEDETRFYAKRYGQLTNLIGFNVGPFSEPFVSERGGFLQYDDETEYYELTQYTPEVERLWHSWLLAHPKKSAGINIAYGTGYLSVNDVPLPRNETDDRFIRPAEAYSDFVQVLNDWFMGRYDICRQIWHEESHRADVPFILQFSGFDAEKFQLGRPAYREFNLNDWMSRADAIGLSLYTNGGYKDFGHGSIQSMVAKIKKFRLAGKEVFILEGGCEDPKPVLNENELRFCAALVKTLEPKTYIYEFLRDPFYASNEKNSGRLMSTNGMTRPKVFKVLKKIIEEIRTN